MFFNSKRHHVATKVIVVLFCVHIIRIFLNDKINLYIHPRYNLFTIIMATVSLLILLTSLFTNFKVKSTRSERFNFLDFTVILILAVAFLVKPSALSVETSQRKSLNLPNYELVDEDSSNYKCRSIDNNIESIITNITYSPLNCYESQEIELEGFLFTSLDNPLPSGYSYFGRVVLSCCIVDARPYALPIKHKIPNSNTDQWVRVSGELKVDTINGIEQIYISPVKIDEIEDPDIPYEFINN